jgi:hypothetical protein
MTQGREVKMRANDVAAIVAVYLILMCVVASIIAYVLDTPNPILEVFFKDDS